MQNENPCPIAGCTNEVLEGNVHCAHHYFTLSDDEIRKGWEAEGGLKFDQDKPRTDLLDAEALEELAQVLTFGAQKYSAENWRKGISFRRLLAAALRHIFAIMRGEDRDPETGLKHAAHAMCCMMFLIWMMNHRRDMDDRWQSDEEMCPHRLKRKNCLECWVRR